MRFIFTFLFLIIFSFHSTLYAKETASPALHYQSYTLPKNGTLSQALAKMGAPFLLSYQISKLKQGNLFIQLRAGDALLFGFDNQQHLKEIRYPKTRTTTYVLKIADDGTPLQIEKQVKTIEHHIQITGGKIKNSLYLSGQKAGLSDKTIMKLADIFAWEIDFIRQLRPGDTFKVIYEQNYIDGKYIGDGDILAAEITTHDGKHHYAFLFKNRAGEKIGYYDEKGHNLKKAFLRNPVDYVRITSGFQPRRYHPILHKWRAHHGVDYAGSIGTPIHVTGNGRIIRRGWSRSYGRVIYVRHGRKYMTVYAHMSRFGKYKKGDWVKQGDIIGYIGMSGWATGPHLHYEFRINGKHVDPLKVKFPDAAPIAPQYRKAFEHVVSVMKSQLDRTPAEPASWVKGFE